MKFLLISGCRAAIKLQSRTRIAHFDALFIDQIREQVSQKRVGYYAPTTRTSVYPLRPSDTETATALFLRHRLNCWSSSEFVVVEQAL
ncbi:hypothetical protein LshimejAT787_1700410 [Lyophyllum shimeji]|uniref:Uncharacterized protein n=1 Tax=Lyophyllum shimeji TaxID=47721 RepID=A0A9P3PZL8_LYOSH|nr:hypothetical protein LshimejAT787_1700410 [Lyophyllum shimeji]